MSNCHCIIKHVDTPEHRSLALAMLESSDKTEWLMALAMLSPCPGRDKS